MAREQLGDAEPHGYPPPAFDASTRHSVSVMSRRPWSHTQKSCACSHVTQFMGMLGPAPYVGPKLAGAGELQDALA